MTATSLVLPARRERVWLPAVLLVAVSSIVVTSLARWGPDWPAQEFRAWIAGHDGLSVWTTRWYSGSPLPGYSVLYPLFAGLIGPGTLGVASSVAITWAACGLSPRMSHRRAVVVGVAIAVSVTQNLLIGQVPFLLGAAFGVAAVRSLLAGKHWAVTAALAALSSLGSPLAGMFLILLAPAIAARRDWRDVLPLGAAASGSLVALVVGGASGPFPCPWMTAAGVAVFCVAVWLFAPPSNRFLRVFVACYLVADIAAFAVPNPVGGNIARLAKLVAIPLACYLLSTGSAWRWIRSVIVGALAVVWPSTAFLTSLLSGATDPSRAESYYQGIDNFLAHQKWTSGRVEIPFTREHWESYFVARQFPIARGWERQSDLQFNAALYEPLTAKAYRAWLDDNAVSFVALPHAPMDDGGRPEAALLRHPPSYLVPVWHDTHWQVWRVKDPRPLVTGAARLTHEGPSSLTLHFARAGTAVVRIRASRLWTTDRPGSCVAGTKQDWLTISSPRAGDVHVRAQLNAALITGTAQRCAAGR